jgi:hypothetical protein
MAILPAVNAAETRLRNVDALSDLVAEAQRRVAEVQRIHGSTVLRLQEQVTESLRLATAGATATNLAMQRFGDQFATTRLSETMKSMQLMAERTNAALASPQMSKTMESLRLMSERTNAALLSPQMSETMKSMQLMAERTNAAALAMQRFGDQFATSLAPLRLTETMELLAQSFRERLHGAFGFSETTAQRIAEFGRNFQLSTDRHIAGVLLTRGWLGVERHLSTWQLARLVNVRGRGKGVEIDRRMCAAFRRNRGTRLRGMTKAWAGVPYLKARRQIIRQAQAAHLDKKYALSIAALLPLVDGLAAEVRRTTIRVAPATRKKVIAVKDVVHLYAPAEGRSRQWSEVVLLAVGERIFKDYDFDTQPAPAKNNRHGVLHGRISHYASEKNSLQTFLLLDVMACIASKHP